MKQKIDHAREFDRDTQLGVQLDLPDTCPVCGFGIHPKYQTAALSRDPETQNPSIIEVVCLCPRAECQRLFIVKYKRSERQDFLLSSVSPVTLRDRVFDPAISTTSPRFPLVYNQAQAAETHGLDLICGAGYRRALEFLVKDYAKTKRKSDEHEEIDKSLLGSCINQYVEHPKVKSIATRATWLGNDETHYIRKWPQKDLADLKALIELTVHWVALDIGSAAIEESMPSPRTTK
jgi:hypothetical protein